jgi:hypothetical protein
VTRPGWLPAPFLGASGAVDQLLVGPGVYWSDWLSARTTSASLWNTLAAMDLKLRAELLATSLRTWAKREGVKLVATVTDQGAMFGYSLWVSVELAEGQRVTWTARQVEQSGIIWTRSKTAEPPTPELVADDAPPVLWTEVPKFLAVETIDLVTDSTAWKWGSVALGLGVAAWLLTWLPRRRG